MRYQGLTISYSSGKNIYVHGISPLEYSLMRGGRRYLSIPVIRHDKDHIGEMMSNITDTKCNNTDCNHVLIIGPDTLPKCDPKSDDEGCFIKKKTENNSYAYGNDR